MATVKEKKHRKESLPYNADAERAVLGSAILKESMANNVLTSLEEGDFFEGRHQLIFRAISSLYSKRVAIDILTVTEELMNIQELDNVGGVKYLQECADSMVALQNLEFYINIVQNQSVLRKLLIACRDIDDKYDTEEIEDINDFIIQSELEFKEAIAKRRISQFKPVSEIANSVKNDLDRLAAKPVNEDDKDLIGLTTGYHTINKYTQGFQPGTVTIIAGRPGLGKTALALNFALNASRFHDVPVAFFSLEMESSMLVKRLIANLSCIDLKKITSGNFGNDRDARFRVASAIKELSQYKLYIDDTPGLRLTDIVAKSKKLSETQKDLGMIVIDYLGLIQLTKKGGDDSRNEEVRKISLALKDLARELKVPIVVLSQLSRSVEKRESKRPMLSDLRDSGSIEQDADVIMLLYRSDYYDKEKKSNNNNWQNKKGGEMDDKDKRQAMVDKSSSELLGSTDGSTSIVEVNVAKNRNGNTGKAFLLFYKSYGRFDTIKQEIEDKIRQYGDDFED